MSLKYTIPLFLLLFFSKSYNANSQGCSDAGFCTMGAMKPNQNFRKFKAKVVSVELGQYYGYTKFQTHVFTSYVDVNVGLGTKTTVQLKVPYTVVRGELG